MANPNGAIIYRGASLLTGDPIIAIATGFIDPSDNDKTGGMIQVWILADGDIDPVHRLLAKDSAMICGGCPSQLCGCYVEAGKAPGSVFRSYLADNYPFVAPDDLPELFEGREVRMGAYGDPAAVPLYIWQLSLAKCAGWTGYTHQWRDERVQPYRAILMASVELAMDRRKCKALGWRPFRVALQGEDPTADPILDADLPSEMVCPAAEPNRKANRDGKPIQCIDCLACHGTGEGVANACPSTNARDIYVPAHGKGSKTTYADLIRALGVTAPEWIANMDATLELVR